MKKRYLLIAVLVLSLLTALCFASCGGDNGGGEASGTADAASGTDAESMTQEPGSTQDDTIAATETETETETEDPVISSPEASAFRIIYAANASDTVKDTARQLAQSLASVFGTAPELADDAASYVPGSAELLLGKTNRMTAPLSDSKAARAWCVTVSDTFISLDAVDEAFLIRAVDRLVYDYAQGGDALKLSMITDYTDNGEAFEKSLHFSVPGEPCYTVVYDPEDGDDAAFTAKWFATAYTARGNELKLSDKPVDGASVTLDLNEGLDTDWKVTFDNAGNITVSAKNKDALAWGLTVFTGTGMTANRYGEILIPDTAGMSGDMSSCTREGWGLPVPAYEGGTLAEAVYNDGAGKENDTKALAYSQSYMMCVSGTTREEFDAYIAKLLSCGYKAESTTAMTNPKKSENVYGQYINGVSVVYAYYLGAVSEARIIDDRASVPESVFEYDYPTTAEDKAEVILYGLLMSRLGINSNEPGGDPDISNCGEFMMIHTPDNGLILIDGGSKQQATDAAVEGAWQYMHEITGTPMDQKLTIACWFISHPHGDHCMIVGKLMEKYGDMIEIERLMFNFVPAAMNGLSLSQASRTSITKYCPDAMIMKCHPGQSIRLGGVVLDVMTTHEDIVNAKKGTSGAGEVNSTTSVIRVTMPDGQRAMILGDATTANETFMNKNLHKTEFESRIVQVAHHAWNVLSTMYKNTASEYALWPQYEYSEFTDLNNHRTYATTVAKNLTRSGVKYNYFAGLNTARLTCQGGNIEVNLTDAVY